MKRKLLLLLIISIMIIAGCGSDDPEPVDPETPGGPGEPDQEEISGPLMGLASGPLAVDGSVADYPAGSFEAMGATVHMAYDDNYIYVHLETDTDGWLAAGINNRGGGMNGALMILGYLDGESPAYREDLGGPRNHSAVDTPALDQFYFEHSDGRVIMEFSYPRVFPAGSGYNVGSLEPGETYTLILAAHNNSYDLSRMHSKLSQIDFTVEP